jgi:hypothetical protein
MLYTIFRATSQAATLGLRLVLTAVALTTSPLEAQSEAALKEYFEGQTVTPKLAMPGTEDGIDIYPGTARPLEYPKYADRLKNYGTSIKAGEPVTVTKIKLKSKLIEFQLGGGGYGTFGDETYSNVATAEAPKTKREKNLEAEIKRETDAGRKRAMKEELDDLKAERERENARNRSAVAEAEEHRKQNVRQRRLEGGSRFNLRYPNGVPAEAVTPAAVVAALARYVDFPSLGQSTATGVPRKGMLLPEVDSALGLPAATRERKEGSLRVQTREYATPDGRVTAEFVEGVLFRYRISSD